MPFGVKRGWRGGRGTSAGASTRGRVRGKRVIAIQAPNDDDSKDDDVSLPVPSPGSGIAYLALVRGP